MLGRIVHVTLCFLFVAMLLLAVLVSWRNHGGGFGLDLHPEYGDPELGAEP